MQRVPPKIPHALEIEKIATDAVPPHLMRHHQHPTSINTVTPDSDPESRTWIPASARNDGRGGLIQGW